MVKRTRVELINEHETVKIKQQSNILMFVENPPRARFDATMRITQDNMVRKLGKKVGHLWLNALRDVFDTGVGECHVMCIHYDNAKLDNANVLNPSIGKDWIGDEVGDKVGDVVGVVVGVVKQETKDTQPEVQDIEPPVKERHTVTPDVVGKYFLGLVNNYNTRSRNATFRAYENNPNIILKEANLPDSGQEKYKYAFNIGNAPAYVEYIFNPYPNSISNDMGVYAPTILEEIPLNKGKHIIQLDPIDEVITALPTSAFIGSNPRERYDVTSEIMYSKVLPTPIRKDALAYIDGVIQEIHPKIRFRYGVGYYEYIGQGNPIITLVTTVTVNSMLSPIEKTHFTNPNLLLYPNPALRHNYRRTEYKQYKYPFYNLFNTWGLSQVKLKKVFILTSLDKGNLLDHFREMYPDDLRDMYLRDGVNEMILYIDHNFTVDIVQGVDTTHSLDLNLDEMLGTVPDNFKLTVMVNKVAMANSATYDMPYDSVDGKDLINITASKAIYIDIYNGVAMNLATSYTHKIFRVTEDNPQDIGRFPSTTEYKIIVSRKYTGEVNVRLYPDNYVSGLFNALPLSERTIEKAIHYLSTYTLNSRNIITNVEDITPMREGEPRLGKNGKFINSNRTDNTINFINA